MKEFESMIQILEAEKSKEKIISLQRENVESQYKENMSAIEKQYEEQITVLLRELNNCPQPTDKSTPEMSERLKIQQESLDKLDSLREELEVYKNMYNEIKTQLENQSFKKPRNSKIEKIQDALQKEEELFSDLSLAETDFEDDPSE